MKTIKIILFGLLVFVIIIGIAGALMADDASDLESKKEVAEKVEVEAVEAPKEPVYLWDYSESTDEMDGKTDYFAQIASDNTVDFEFPYNGGSTGFLTIRNKDGKNDVYFQVNKGQFLTSYSNTDYLRIKFDDADLEKYSFSGAADGSSDVVFPDNSAKLISKLKKAKSIKIEAPFYEAGRQIFNFNTEGLVWDK